MVNSRVYSAMEAKLYAESNLSIRLYSAMLGEIYPVVVVD